MPEDYDCLGVGIDLSAGLKKRTTGLYSHWAVSKTARFISLIKDVHVLWQPREMDVMCEMLADWNILLENDDGQFFPTMSPCVIWPEAVAYQNSFEGDFKRIIHENRALYN